MKLRMPQPDQALPGREQAMPVPDGHYVNGHRISPPFPAGLEQAVFGMGCFWGAERKFWEARDSAQLVDWSTAKRVRLPNLKPSTQSISLRLPLHTLERIKAAANARDVPYQSLIKVWLEEKLSA